MKSRIRKKKKITFLVQQSSLAKGRESFAITGPPACVDVGEPYPAAEISEAGTTNRLEIRGLRDGHNDK